MKEDKMKVIVKCPCCDWRILDKVTPASGIIEVTCPKCHKVVAVDLSLRRMIKYRLAMMPSGLYERAQNRIR